MSLPAQSSVSLVHRQDVAPILIVGVAVGCMAWIVATTLWGVIVTYTPLPQWDAWSEVTTQQHWDRLFLQQNEHRLPITRLFLIVDTSLFRGTNKFPLLATFAFQAVNVALLVHLFTRSRPTYWVERLAAAVFAASMLFWFEQWEIFSDGFNIHFVIVVALAIAAFIALALRPGISGFILAVLFATLAASTMANGLVVPFLLISLALWVRRPAWQVASLLVASCVIVFVYLIAYEYGKHEYEHGSLATLMLHASIYTQTYLGGPFESGYTSLYEAWIGRSAELPGHIALVFGGVGLLLFVSAGVVMASGGSRARPAQIALFHIAAFAVITGLMTAAGRMQFGLGQALSSRYGTMVLVFWIATVFLLWSFAPQSARAIKNAVVAGFAVIGLFIGCTQIPLVEGLRSQFLDRRDAEAALLAKVDAADVLRRLLPAPEFLRQQAQALEQQHLSFFARPWPNWLGTQLTSHASVTGDARCIGYLDKVTPVAGSVSWSANGWAWDRKAATVPEAVVLVGPDGTVVGFGLPSFRRPDVAKVYPRLSGLTGWQGYFSGATPDLVSAYIVLADAEDVCRLTKSR